MVPTVSSAGSAAAELEVVSGLLVARRSLVVAKESEGARRGVRLGLHERLVAVVRLRHVLPPASRMVSPHY